MEMAGPAQQSRLNAPELVAKIEQKALQFSALLRELDNHPVTLDERLRLELEDVLDQVECRIAATKALEQRTREDS